MQMTFALCLYRNKIHASRLKCIISKIESHKLCNSEDILFLILVANSFHVISKFISNLHTNTYSHFQFIVFFILVLSERGNSKRCNPSQPQIYLRQTRIRAPWTIMYKDLCWRRKNRKADPLSHPI